MKNRINASEECLKFENAKETEGTLVKVFELLSGNMDSVMKEEISPIEKMCRYILFKSPHPEGEELLVLSTDLLQNANNFDTQIVQFGCNDFVSNLPTLLSNYPLWFVEQ